MLKVLLCFLCFVSYNISTAQISIEGFDLNGRIDSWYDSVIGDHNKAALEGVYFSVPPQTRGNHQFYKSYSWTSGVLTYGGQDYTDIEMMYNIFTDILILRNNGVSNTFEQPLLPDQKKISKFKIYDQTVIYLDDSEAPNTGQGFYFQEYDGEFLSLYSKRIKEQLVQSRQLEYAEEVKHYMKYNGKYVRYKGFRSIYKLFPENKTEIKNFVKSYTRVTSKAHDDSVIKTIAFCNDMMKQKI